MKNISATELRIGNYVYSGISSNQVIEVYPMLFVQLSKIEDKEHNIKPIPLTEQWFLDFKATKLNDDRLFQFSRFRFIWKSGYKYWYTIDALDKTYMTKIEFVHEFQNFIFVMDGVELKLKQTTPNEAFKLKTHLKPIRKPYNITDTDE